MTSWMRVRKDKKKWFCAVMVMAVMLLYRCTTGFAAVKSAEDFEKEWETIQKDWTYVALSPGSDETQMNFAWYSRKGEPVSFRYGRKSDLSDGNTVKVKQKKAQKGYKSNRVTLKKLKPGARYYYQADEKEIASFRTNEKGKSFSFIYVGDPQIGKSNPKKAEKDEGVTEEFLLAQNDAVQNDALGWNNTIDAAYKKSGKKADFILSAGDQIETKAKSVDDRTASEIEYSGYLCPELLRSIPVATTVGSHDDDNPNYDYHFNVPNQSTLGQNDYVGGDYWFTYGSALFLMLNTQDSNTAEHKEFMEEAIRKNPGCTWRIVTLHQDIYGSAMHSVSENVILLRYQMLHYFEENDIDVVLTGHDHSYTRSKFLKGDVPVETVEIDGTVINPDGILYMTAGSSSGSKYYDLVKEKQPYVAARWQEEVPTYSIVKVTKDTFTIDTYRTDNGKKIDDTVKIQKYVQGGDIGQASVDAIGGVSYTGKPKTPSVSVRQNGIPLKYGTDYTVSYRNHQKIGTAEAIVTGIGAFTGTQTVSFQIVPAKVKLKSAVSKEKGKATVKIKKKDRSLDGCQIVYSRSKKFRNSKKVETDKAQITLKKLKKGKVYYIKARGYKNVSGKTYFGKYGKAFKVKVKA